MTIAGQRGAGSVVYPDTDYMGEHELQRAISVLLAELLTRLFAQRGVTAHAGSNTFIYWVEGDPETTIAPDVYVLPRVSPVLEVPCWKLWELDGVKPSFAVEVASTNWKKDYDEAPALYAAMGCEELVIFDPHATERSRKRVRWQHYKRDARGAFRRATVRATDRVWVASLGFWLREVRDAHGRQRLRVGLGDLGTELLPTADEAARASDEAAREADEARRKSDEARRVAEADAARLRVENEALRAAAKKSST